MFERESGSDEGDPLEQTSEDEPEIIFQLFSGSTLVEFRVSSDHKVSRNTQTPFSPVSLRVLHPRKFHRKVDYEKVVRNISQYDWSTCYNLETPSAKSEALPDACRMRANPKYFTIQTIPISNVSSGRLRMIPMGRG